MQQGGFCAIMESRQDRIRRELFSGTLPDMPQDMREFFNMAFMFRRKHIIIGSKSPDIVYEAAIEDMRIINEAYDYNPFLLNLLLECYDDIARSVEAREANG